ncbi:bifunctional diguanylate cyclase/phosphodiesterase [Actinoplanes sp. NPDC051851]|uniref:putative bifunctional diguanylate cyclase/phosphodiesterase n=1 Tax=Actinoplanes sp. NPDC051851 TaxID=3154753 RepID=UPI00341BD3CA
MRSGQLGLPRFAVVLITMVLVSEILAVVYPPARSAVLGIWLLVLDPLGVVYSWRAARRATGSALTWRLATAGRACSAASTVIWTVDTLHHSAASYWGATVCGLAMFALLSASALSISTYRLAGSHRWAFLAEVGTVLSSGFMLIWYFALEPALVKGAGAAWGYELGYPLGNLLLLCAVVVVLIRGAVARMVRPLMVLLGGMLLYAVGDAAFSAVRVQGQATGESILASSCLVIASLLMTVAAMQQCARDDTEAAPATMPAWSAHLPYACVAAGSTLLVVFTIREHAFMPWGGLAIGQAVMTATLALRQFISVRDSHRLTVIDALTGLANITGLRLAMDRRLRDRNSTALMLVDLDDFKLINDGYGHAVGDRVLIEFARLTRGAIRRGDVAARVGGDEFVVLLAGVAEESQAVAVADRILAALADHPVLADGDEITIRASIGLALAAPGDSAQELQRRADLAMYESKRSGAHGWRLYDASMIDRRAREALIGDKLLPSLAAGQFELHYQPIVQLPEGSVRSVEALLRWTHPALGPVSPVEFIPIAERTGAIVEIGSWVLAEACAQAQRWRESGLSALHMNVNVSPRQLQNGGFLAEVLATLERTGLPAGRLLLEITESAVVDESAVPALDALRRHGVRIAIDDFGTGYSSLQYLARLPVDVLKIDRAFVAELDGTPRGAAVAEAVIRLSTVLDLCVVAEGVETTAQATELQSLGCSVAQGYLYGKPMTAAEFTAVSSMLPTHAA